MSFSEKLDELKADAKGKNGDKKRNTVIAIGTVLLVIIAYLTLKHMQNSSAAAAGTTPTSDTSGVTGDAGAPDDQSLAAIANAIGSQSGVLGVISTQLKHANAKARKALKVERKTEKKEGHEATQLKKLREELKKTHGKTGSHKGGSHPPKKTGGHGGHKGKPISVGVHLPKHPPKHATHHHAAPVMQGPKPPRKGHATHPVAGHHKIGK